MQEKPDRLNPGHDTNVQPGADVLRGEDVLNHSDRRLPAQGTSVFENHPVINPYIKYVG